MSASAAATVCQLFAEQCCQTLKAFHLEGKPSLPQIRQQLLSRQRSCLEDIVSSWNKDHNTEQITVEEVQSELRKQQQQQQTHDSTMKAALDALNEEARLAFCRIVLQSHCRRTNETPPSDLIASGRLSRNDLLEFCGLCTTAVRLEVVQRYLQEGIELFSEPETKDTSTHFPQHRLERIQRMFLEALSYDSEFGKSELERLFFRQSNKDNEFTHDAPVQKAFAYLASSMNAAIANATLYAQHQALPSTDDGTTKVLSVKYSEKLVDASTGETLVEEGQVPSQQSIEEHASTASPSPARIQAAAVLQQEIWGELLALRDEARQAKLEAAAAIAREVDEKAAAITDLSEKIAFLRSIDPETQRNLVMHKLWQRLVEQNGGKEPQIKYHS